MSDFRVLDNYPQGTANNSCYFCRASVRTLQGNRQEKVMDTMIMINFEGYLVLCETCIIEAGSLLGMLSVDKATELRETVTEAKAEVLQLKNELSVAEDVVTSLTRWKDIADAKAEPSAK